MLSFRAWQKFIRSIWADQISNHIYNGAMRKAYQTETRE